MATPPPILNHHVSQKNGDTAKASDGSRLIPHARIIAGEDAKLVVAGRQTRISGAAVGPASTQFASKPLRR